MKKISQYMSHGLLFSHMYFLILQPNDFFKAFLKFQTEIGFMKILFQANFSEKYCSILKKNIYLPVDLT